MYEVVNNGLCGQGASWMDVANDGVGKNGGGYNGFVEDGDVDNGDAVNRYR